MKQICDKIAEKYLQIMASIFHPRMGQYHFPKGEILEGIVLGKDGVPAQLEILIPERYRAAVQSDVITAEPLVQTGCGNVRQRQVLGREKGAYSLGISALLLRQ